jgi:hypothetical protein
MGPRAPCITGNLVPWLVNLANESEGGVSWADRAMGKLCILWPRCTKQNVLGGTIGRPSVFELYMRNAPRMVPSTAWNGIQKSKHNLRCAMRACGYLTELRDLRVTAGLLRRYYQIQYYKQGVVDTPCGNIIEIKPLETPDESPQPSSDLNQANQNETFSLGDSIDQEPSKKDGGALCSEQGGVTTPPPLPFQITDARTISMNEYLIL